MFEGMFEVRAEYPLTAAGNQVAQQGAGYGPVVMEVVEDRQMRVLIWRFHDFEIAARVRWRLECRYPLERVTLREL